MAKDLETRFHEHWIGLVQPIEGLVVSVPVLVEAQCMERLPPRVQDQLRDLCLDPEALAKDPSSATLPNLDGVFTDLLGFDLAAFDRGEALPEALSLYVPEGKQLLRPTAALRKLDAATPSDTTSDTPAASPSATLLDDSTPASRAGAAYECLIWEIPAALDLDTPESETGTWNYPPAAKFDRLLRECRVPIGLLSNGRQIRLFYAPHGESTGAMTFRVGDMVQVGGRPILDAFVALLSDFRWFGAPEPARLPAILRDSRARQADVTNELADQLFEALGILLAGFEAAAERDGDARLRDALTRDDDHLYNGLLTLLLRMVFLLYAEDRGLMPMEHPTYGRHLSILALYDELLADHGAFPDTMSRRFGAYPRLVALFRAVYFGVRHGEGDHNSDRNSDPDADRETDHSSPSLLYIPPRYGVLFDPEVYPFLEGWGPTGAAPTSPTDRADVRVPTLSDEAVFTALDKLLRLDGQRLSYRALEVEQIGSVYERLMGYHVVRVTTPSVCLRPSRVWVGTEEVRAQPKNLREKWLAELGLPKAKARKLAELLSDAEEEAETASEGAAKSKSKHEQNDEALLAALCTEAVGGSSRAAAANRAGTSAAGGHAGPIARPGALVIQPGEERRRTSSHYTPRSLTEPIVRRTLEPLITAMGGEPPSEKLLRLKVCDPAMGSGAFLVAACRFLADQVVAAWTREGVLAEKVRLHEDPVMHARRLVAQRCLYGVDKNPFAVNLAKLSLWLETLAKDEPFTFVDHCLKCGDSLVGLDIEQIKRFDWRSTAARSDAAVAAPAPSKGKGRKGKSANQWLYGQQFDLFERAIEKALFGAYHARKRLLDLAEVPGDHADLGAEKARLHAEAELALERARIVADVCIGAFFEAPKEKARLALTERRRSEVETWLMDANATEPTPEVQAALDTIRATQRPFHWGIEFPEVFWDERPDPLAGDSVNHKAWLDAVVGNPPFMGKNGVSEAGGDAYLDWLKTVHEGAHGNADLSAHFFRRADFLLADHGTMGLVATNTIAQGDTRATGLQHLVLHGAKIYDAHASMPWPGEASVSVSVVHLAKGSADAAALRCRLDGAPVPNIDSRLTPGVERPDPKPLPENAGKSFQGSIVLGMGFILTPEEREALIAKNPRNGERIFPYIGGEEVNTSPTQSFHRYVINFGDMTLEEAERWPDLIKIVREKVKPERDALKDNADGRRRKERWWQYGRVTPALEAALVGVSRTLAASLVTKHVTFAFAPATWIFSHKLVVIPRDSFSLFGVLQSSIHEVWARSMSSTLETRLNYSPSDCFETFPFPHATFAPPEVQAKENPALLELAKVAEALYTARATYRQANQVGLTKLYNALKDPTQTNPALTHLRTLHESLDQATLHAYAWQDLTLPPYTTPPNPNSPENQLLLTRLLSLNASR